MLKSVLRNVDQDSSERDDNGRNEQGFGRVTERRLEHVWIVVETDAAENAVDNEEDDVYKKEDVTDGG